MNSGSDASREGEPAPGGEGAAPRAIPSLARGNEDGGRGRLIAWILSATALCALAVFAAYFPALRGGFVFDDPLLIEGDPLVTNPAAALEDIFLAPYFHAGTGGEGYYRPLQTLLFRLEWWFYGGKPFGFHLDNLLIQAAACALLFCLLRVACGVRGAAALAAALLFAVHPLTSESTAWISGRTDPLAFLFMAISLLFLHRWLAAPSGPAQARAGRPNWPLGAALGCFVAALLFKESVFLYPVAALAWMAARRRAEHETPDLGARRLWTAFAALSGAAVLVFAVSRILPRGDASTLFFGRGGAGERALTFLSLVPAYLGKVFYPKDLNIAREVHLASGLGDPWIWLGAAILIAAAAVAGLAVRKGNPGLALGASLFLCGLLVHASVLFPIAYGFHEMAFPFFERYAYLPLAGLCLMVASLPWVGRRHAGSVLLLAGAFVLCPLLGRMARERAVEWQSDASLFLVGVERYPDSPSLRFNLGQAYLRDGKFREAQAAFFSAARLDPGMTQARIHEAVALAGFAGTDKAAAELKAMAEAEPENGYVWEALGYVYSGGARWLDAFESYSRAIPLLDVPEDAKASRNRAAKVVKEDVERLFEKKNYAAVKETADRVIAWQPRCTWALEARGLALFEQGDTKEAQHSLEEALRTADYPPIRGMEALAKIYDQEGLTQEAAAIRADLDAMK